MADSIWNTFLEQVRNDLFSIFTKAQEKGTANIPYSLQITLDMLKHQLLWNGFPCAPCNPGGSHFHVDPRGTTLPYMPQSRGPKGEVAGAGSDIHLVQFPSSILHALLLPPYLLFPTLLVFSENKKKKMTTGWQKTKIDFTSSAYDDTSPLGDKDWVIKDK